MKLGSNNSIFILDMTGKIVFETELKGTIVSQNKVSVEIFSSGLYSVWAETLVFRMLR